LYRRAQWVNFAWIEGELMVFLTNEQAEFKWIRSKDGRSIASKIPVIESANIAI